MTAADFVSRLGARGKPRKVFNGWQCCCPAHDDKSPSLSVADGYKGGVVVKCFAGCTEDAICAAVGIAKRDLYPPRPEITTAPPASPPAKPAAVARETFDWTACVAAFTDAKAQKLATWRGLSVEFVRWLHAQNVVGIFEGNFSFANHGDCGAVVSAHIRLGGKPPWIFKPGGHKAAPLVFGNLKNAGYPPQCAGRWLQTRCNRVMTQEDYNLKFWGEQCLNLHALFTSTVNDIQAARRHTRSGHKDEARRILNSVRNGRVVEILKPIQWPEGLAVDVPFLEGQIRELVAEVHPLTAPDNSDDLAEIKRSLHLIAGAVVPLATLVSSFSFGRAAAVAEVNNLVKSQNRNKSGVRKQTKKGTK